jgi:hypothetical protein
VAPASVLSVAKNILPGNDKILAISNLFSQDLALIVVGKAEKGSGILRIFRLALFSYSAVSTYNAVISQHVLHIACPTAGGFCFKRSLETSVGIKQ